MTDDIDSLFSGIDKGEEVEERQVVLCDTNGSDVHVCYLRPLGSLFSELSHRDKRELFVNKSETEFVRVHIHIAGMVSYSRYRDFEEGYVPPTEYSSFMQSLGLEQMEE